ncbi:radical SAM protein [bacterium]|nr:radical SAM protein [bacterium]
MSRARFRHVYGPVASRRLGRSLGVDLVPFKTCSYDCIYCQLGRTTHKTTARREYAPIEEILVELREKLPQTPKLDYISLAGSGEPTLHAGIGEVIRRIKDITSLPVAVLTNGSLLWMPEVRDALLPADLVLPSLDAGSDHLFHAINRPAWEIDFAHMVGGLAEFTHHFGKPVWLEVFLLAGINDTPSEIAAIAAHVNHIRPTRVQLNTVSRPPCKEFARPVQVERLRSFVPLFGATVDVIAGELSGGTSTGPQGMVDDGAILALLDRRPCTAEDIATGLGLHPHEVAKRLVALLSTRTVKETRLGERRFYTVTGARS